MNSKFLFVLIVCSVLACQDETFTSTKSLDDMTSTDATLKYSGSFTNGPYGAVKGMAEVFENQDGTLEVKLAEFNTNQRMEIRYISYPDHPISLNTNTSLFTARNTIIYLAMLF